VEADTILEKERSLFQVLFEKEQKDPIFTNSLFF
jgi:hypothetical protein